MASGEARAGKLRRLFLLISCLLFAQVVRANDLQVSSNRIHLDESVQVTVVLTGTFAERDEIDLPLHNMQIETGPRMSSEFSWINGVTQRRRTFSYTVRPLALGSATIGPLVITDEKGRRDTLGPLRIEILADSTAALGGDPAALLRHYAATSRSRVALGVEVDQERAVTGEQVVVTWYVYTAESIESVSVTSAPPMSDFWTEEITVNRADDTEVTVDGMAVRKVPVRRVAIFPLRDGTLTIPPLEINAEVMEVIGGAFDRFGMVNARTVSVRRRSAPATVSVSPVAGSQVGTYTMRCGNARASETGLVAIDVTVNGDGNVRAAAAPRFVTPPDAEVQVLPGELKVERKPEGVTMQRAWRFLLFPRRTGSLAIPTLSFGYHDPAAAAARAVNCSFPTLEITNLDAVEQPVGEESTDGGRGATWPWLVGTVAIGVIAATALLTLRRRRERQRLVRKARSILAAENNVELRRRFDDLLASADIAKSAVMSEASERGELARAVSSLIEYRIAQPAHASELDEELQERLVELIAALRGGG